MYIIFITIGSFIVYENYADQRDIDVFIKEVCEPEIPTDPIVERLNLVEEENNYLKEKIKKMRRRR